MINCCLENTTVEPIIIDLVIKHEPALNAKICVRILAFHQQLRKQGYQTRSIQVQSSVENNYQAIKDYASTDLFRPENVSAFEGRILRIFRTYRRRASALFSCITTFQILQYNTLDNFKNFHSFLMSSDLKASPKNASIVAIHTHFCSKAFFVVQ